jgi:hypothetical protein
MRTTLTLDDDLAGLLKQRARELGIPFKEAVPNAVPEPFSPVAGRRMGTGSQWAQRCPVFFTRRGNHIRRLLHRLRGKMGNPVSGTFLRVAPDPAIQGSELDRTAATDDQR